jgi:hypothetical protein
MGSIDVHDGKLVKWVPYVSDYEKLIQHFKDTSEERASPNHMGRYIVGTRSKSRNSTIPSVPQPVKVNLVTPVSQADEMAKSQWKQKQLLGYSDDGRRKRYKRTKMDKLCF